MYNPDNKNALQKYFMCQHCGKSFRTRQGLSGHIQFKHGPYKTKPSAWDMAADIRKKLDIWQICVKTLGYPTEVSKAGRQALHRWDILRSYFNVLGIAVDDRDFKLFMLQNFNY